MAWGKKILFVKPMKKFKKGDIVKYKPRPAFFGKGVVLRNQKSDIVSVKFAGFEQPEYRALYYNLELVKFDNEKNFNLKDSLFEI